MFRVTSSLPLRRCLFLLFDPVSDAYPDLSFQGFYEALEKGSLSGNVVTGCRMILTDGAFHAVDSSELAFRLATIGAFREVYRAANPVILEPIMTVEVVAPVDFQSMIFILKWVSLLSSDDLSPFQVRSLAD